MRKSAPAVAQPVSQVTPQPSTVQQYLDEAKEFIAQGDAAGAEDYNGAKTHRANAEDLVAKAKDLDGKGEEKGIPFYKDAANRIADAEKLGATQRETAKVTGKSVGWINALLQWRAGGFNGKPSDATNRKSDKPKSAEAFLKMTEHILADADVKLAKAPTPDVVDACRDVAEKWDDLAEKLDAMLAKPRPRRGAVAAVQTAARH